MNICFPETNGTCPPNYTIWGTYNVNNPATNGSAVMTNVNNSNDVVHAANFQFRSDGIWTAQFAGLTEGATYNVNASYNSGNQTISAQQVNNVTVNANAPVVEPPPPSPPPPPPDDSQRQALSAPATLLGPPIIGTVCYFGSCSTYLPIRQLQVVTSNTRTKRTFSIVSGLVNQGMWTALIPLPANYQSEVYICDVLFLDERGQVLQQTRVRLIR
jgi:hypothetical protein